MTHAPERSLLLAIDVGATSIKRCLVDATGRLVGRIEREPTPYPCSPKRLVDLLVQRCGEYDCETVVVGFPGDMIDGHVVEPGNLSRPRGIGSPIDPVLHDEWTNFAFQNALAARLTATVRVVNDATLAAYGYATGQGRELVFTLGTGLGIALVVDGEVVKIRDIGNELFENCGTYDEVFGESARAADQTLWAQRLHRALVAFVVEFHADAIHLGGGNARHVRPDEVDDVAPVVVFNDNEGTLRGAARVAVAH